MLQSMAHKIVYQHQNHKIRCKD